MSEFREKVLKTVCKIPFGKVASYGQIALLAGNPRGARQVGWVLNQTDCEKRKIPWWRVVNNAGRVSIKGSEYGAYLQKALLEKEGIVFTGEFEFDIKRYRWREVT